MSSDGHRTRLKVFFSQVVCSSGVATTKSFRCFVKALKLDDSLPSFGAPLAEASESFLATMPSKRRVQGS